jgi:hypothetical protein
VASEKPFIDFLHACPHAVMVPEPGLEAIPSAKFASNYAYFQLVMLAYNNLAFIQDDS